MNRDELQRLRDLPIEKVAQRLGLEVRHHKALCPFHQDRHPSLSFHTGRNTYRCFVCGAHGGNIDLAMQMLHKDFPDACEWLGGQRTTVDGQRTTVNSQRTTVNDAERYAPYFDHPWLSERAQRFLFDQRRLDPRVVRWCRLTTWRDRRGNEWLQIPYYDQQRRLVGIQNRNLSGTEPRFRFPQGSRCTVYNLPVLTLLQDGEPLYITEGCSDCWAMLSAGHKAVAIPSATLLNPHDLELLADLHTSRHTSFHMYPDSDAPGERLFLQLRGLLPQLEHHQLPKECKDFAEYYKSHATNP